MIRLERPHAKFKQTYIKAVKEIKEKGADNESNEHYLKNNIDELENNFKAYSQMH